MKKIINPFHSESANGQFAKSMVCYKNKGKTYFRRYFKPAEKKTPAKLKEQNYFKSAVYSWQKLSNFKKQSWNLYCKNFPLSGYNFYISNFLKAKNENLTPPTFPPIIGNYLFYDDFKPTRYTLEKYWVANLLSYNIDENGILFPIDSHNSGDIVINDSYFTNPTDWEAAEIELKIKFIEIPESIAINFMWESFDLNLIWWWWHHPWEGHDFTNVLSFRNIVGYDWYIGDLIFTVEMETNKIYNIKFSYTPTQIIDFKINNITLWHSVNIPIIINRTQPATIHTAGFQTLLNYFTIKPIHEPT